MIHIHHHNIIIPFTVVHFDVVKGLELRTQQTVWAHSCCHYLAIVFGRVLAIVLSYLVQKWPRNSPWSNAKMMTQHHFVAQARVIPRPIAPS